MIMNDVVTIICLFFSLLNTISDAFSHVKTFLVTLACHCNKLWLSIVLCWDVIPLLVAWASVFFISCLVMWLVSDCVILISCLAVTNATFSKGRYTVTNNTFSLVFYDMGSRVLIMLSEVAKLCKKPLKKFSWSKMILLYLEVWQNFFCVVSIVNLFYTVYFGSILHRCVLRPHNLVWS